MKNKQDSHTKEQDYYIDEQGRFVMTEEFHKKRGFCCGNQCKHCPYTKPSVKGNTILESK